MGGGGGPRIYENSILSAYLLEKNKIITPWPSLKLFELLFLHDRTLKRFNQHKKPNFFWPNRVVEPCMYLFYLASDAWDRFDWGSLELGGFEYRREHACDEGCLAEDFEGRAYELEFFHDLNGFVHVNDNACCTHAKTFLQITKSRLKFQFYLKVHTRDR